VADHRQIIERVFKVVQDRIDQAERVSLQKLEEIEHRSKGEFEKSRHRHEKKLRQIEKRRRRGRGRDAHSREGQRDRGHRGPDVGGEGGEHTRRPRRRAKATPEQKLYRQARRRANLRLAFYTHFAAYAGVLMMLLVTTGSFRVLAIVGFSWGIGVFLHYFWTLLAPQLRESWIEREVGDRVESNVTSERLRVETRHTQNLESLSASIAHEIRNPITAAKSLVQQMGEDPVSNDNLEYARVALDELDRVERSISHLLRFARDEDLRLVDLELGDVLHSALETFKDRIERCSVQVECQLDTPGAMHGDPDKLRRVLINLIGNAIDAMTGAGTPDPRLTIMSGDNLAGSEVWLRIQDNGPGMDAETQARIFDPFYTTKAEGTGLGLALAKKIVDVHGGSLELQSSPEGGTEFVLSLPKGARNGETRA
jgi:two-component system sensor histidine kinase HydH